VLAHPGCLAGAAGSGRATAAAAAAAAARCLQSRAVPRVGTQCFAAWSSLACSQPAGGTLCPPGRPACACVRRENGNVDEVQARFTYIYKQLEDGNW
jgi:hypothetical protein